jgi:hypothetical protein
MQQACSMVYYCSYWSGAASFGKSSCFLLWLLYPSIDMCGESAAYSDRLTMAHSQRLSVNTM